MNRQRMQATMKGNDPNGLPYEDMGYCPPPNRKLPPVPGQHSNYNTIDRIKNGKGVISRRKDTWFKELYNNTWFGNNNNNLRAIPSDYTPVFL